MIIDIQTMIVLTGVMHLVQVLVFLQQYRSNPTVKGPGWWLVWSLLEVVAFTVMLLRGNPALLPFIILIQSPLNLAGTFFVYFGVRRFLGKGLNLRVMVPLFGLYYLVHLYFTLISDNIGIRSLELDIMLVVLAFMTAYELLRGGPRFVPAARFIAAFLILHGLFFTYRSFAIIYAGYQSGSILMTISNVGQYFDALLIGIIWTIGFIIMMNQKLREEISKVKEHFEQIFETSPDAALLSRAGDGLIINVNEGFIKISGYAREELEGQTTLNVNLWADHEERNRLVHQILTQGEVHNYEATFRRKNGELFTGLISASHIEYAEEPCFLTLTRDISDRKKAEIKVKRKNDELVKLNAERDRFYSIIAHDLRSPFSSFLGLTQLLSEGLPGLSMEEIGKIARSMEKSAVNLYSLLEDLLSWSRVKQGLMPFNPGQVILSSEVEDTMVLLIEQAKAKSIDLSHDIDNHMVVYADTGMLKTVLRNLMANAIKFTPSGGKVTVTACPLADGWTEICVHDTGIGMPATTLNHLFEIDSSLNRKGTQGEQGTGLGLLLCNEFVTMHGGRISAISKPGKGSVFCVTLPPRA